MRKELKNATLVGRLIMPRLEIDAFHQDRDYAERISQLVRESLVGGFCVFGGTAELVVETVNQLQSLAVDSQLLFSCDCEFGLPMRLTTGGTEFPDAMAIAKTGKPQYAYQVGRAIAREMRAIGLHWNFAPVADVNSNPANPIINTRAFGDNPSIVAEFACEFMRGLQQEGVAATAKHFPGHGDTSVDSHRELPIIEKYWDEFGTIELPPFESLISAGVASIMTGHLAAPRLAGYIGASEEERFVPATLSYILTTKLLRERLGFGGVIVTDAMEMHAITKHFGQGEADVQAIAAGADVLLMPVDPRATHAALTAALSSSQISMGMIRSSIDRIEQLKSRVVFIPGSAKNLGEYSEAHLKLADEVAREAVELRGVLNVSGANILILADDRADAMEKAKFFANSFVSRSQSVKIISPGAWSPGALEFDQNTIIASFYRARGYVGVHAPRSVISLVREIAKSFGSSGVTPRGLILFGSPYLDQEFQTHPGFVLKTYSESMPSVRAVIQMMKD